MKFSKRVKNVIIGSVVLTAIVLSSSWLADAYNETITYRNSFLAKWDVAKMRWDGKTHRESSWDKKGTNFDFWTIKPGETQVIADVKGPGAITHIWITQYASKNPDHYRKVWIQMYWDGEKNPSVSSPLGDFFCLGNSVVNSFNSAPFMVSAVVNNKKDGNAGLNCYLPMPFKKSARIEIVNKSDKEFIHYFHIDWESCIYLPDGLGYFNAQFRSEFCEKSGGYNTVNLDGKDNYVILNAEGVGHYIGCNLSVIKNGKDWWGEGDETIWIDGDKKPTINGTGTEDYFGHAWGMQGNAGLYSGSSLSMDYTGGYQTSYVFHMVNPIRFRKSIKVSIEHGTGNNLSGYYSSVAYWYQKELRK